MTKAKISQYDAVAANNTDVNGVNIAEGCPPSGMNNMGREIMAALKRFQTGADGDSVTVGGSLVVSGTATTNTLTAGPVSATTLNTSGAVVFNDAGADVDFRVEGDTDANLLFVDASADRVGVGTGTPSALLDVDGNALIYGLTVGRGAGNVSTNTAVGASALADNTTGTSNTANGQNALRLNTTGTSNTGIGRESLYSNTTGANNTAVGNNALFANTTGGANTALGNLALDSNTTGANNVAVGNEALQANTTASNNTAVGYQAGYSNTTGANLCAIGQGAGYSSTAGQNTFIGNAAGYNVSTGSGNTFIGGGIDGTSYPSGYFMTTGSKNTILGNYSGNQGGLDIRTSSNYIVLSDGDGNPRLYFNGQTFYSIGVYNVSGAGGSTVVVDSGGNLYRSTSSLKYKRDIENATYGLAEVLQLRPVTYKSKKESEGDKVFGGLIAEEVHAVGLTEFVQYADDGTPDALQYGQMVSLCIKAIQELSAKNDALEARIAALEGN